MATTIMNKSHHFSHLKFGTLGNSRAPYTTHAMIWSVTYATASLHTEPPMIPARYYTRGHVSHVDMSPGLVRSTGLQEK